MNDDADFARQHGYYFEDLEVGTSAVFSKTLTDADVTMFAGVSGDSNPLHLSETFASHARTRGRVVHGMVTASLISTLVGTRLPGPGSLWMGQQLNFRVPVRVGETVVAEAVVVELFPERQRVRMETECRVNGRVVIDGHALVWVPRRAG